MMAGDTFPTPDSGPLSGAAPLTATPQFWGAEALWEQLVPLLPGLSVEVVLSTPSTNSALLARARALPGTDEAVQVRRSVESGAFGRRAIDVAPCLLIAEHQTAGRGRHGRTWQSSAGMSLTFSLALPMTMADWSGLSLAVGVALAEAIEAVRRPESDAPALRLKWPNDVWLGAPGAGGRKLGGVLVETVSVGHQRLAVIGVGVNVRPADGSFTEEDLSSGYACVQELDPAMDAPHLVAQIARPLVEAVQAFERGGFAAFAGRYEALDGLRGQPVRTTGTPAVEGVAEGVSATGALRVATADGVREVASGEVGVRVVAPGGAG